jgi:sarcosine oxidase
LGSISTRKRTPYVQYHRNWQRFNRLCCNSASGKSYPDLNIAIIGPDEPINRKTHDGVFASHYDQGRITRILDKTSIGANLAAQSINHYAEIEGESGIQFHHPVGCLRIADEQEHILAVEKHGKQYQAQYQMLSPEQCTEQFPFFSFDGEYSAFAETRLAGYINPRELIRAQLTVAEKHGATIIRETVTSFSEKTDFVEVHTNSGNSYQTAKILISAGGFTNLIMPQN